MDQAPAVEQRTHHSRGDDGSGIGTCSLGHFTTATGLLQSLEAGRTGIFFNMPNSVYRAGREFILEAHVELVTENLAHLSAYRARSR